MFLLSTLRNFCSCRASGLGAAIVLDDVTVEVVIIERLVPDFKEIKKIAFWMHFFFSQIPASISSILVPRLLLYRVAMATVRVRLRPRKTRSESCFFFFSRIRSAKIPLCDLTPDSTRRIRSGKNSGAGQRGSVQRNSTSCPNHPIIPNDTWMTFQRTSNSRSMLQ